MLSQLSDTELG